MTNLIKTYTYGEEIGERVAVKFSAEGTVVKATSPTDKVCGVTLFAGQAGAKGDVVLMGHCLVAVAGAVNAGDYVMATTGGKVKAVDLTDLDAGDVITVVGQVLETASAAAHLNAVVKPQTVVVTKAVEETQEVNNG